MKIISMVPSGLFSVNSYIIVSDRKNAVLIDAPAANDAVLSELEKEGATLKKILLTHGHCDHIDGLADIAEKTGAEVFIHELDLPKLTDNRLNLSEYFSDFMSEPVKHYGKAKALADGDIITVDDITLRVMHTPGHSSGSVCFFTDEVIFSGDTLFNNSIGRTDMLDGNPLLLQKSLKALAEIEEDYSILAGHGSRSVLSVEKIYNPYLRGFSDDDML